MRSEDHWPCWASWRMKAMEAILDKASLAYPDCSAIVTKLRSMAYNTEDRRVAAEKSSFIPGLARY